MRVRITRGEGYESAKVKAAKGDVIEVNDALAAKMFATNWAVPAPEPKRAPVVETAAAAPPVNTAKRTGKARTRKGPQ